MQHVFGQYGDVIPLPLKFGTFKVHLPYSILEYNKKLYLVFRQMSF